MGLYRPITFRICTVRGVPIRMTRTRTVGSFNLWPVDLGDDNKQKVYEIMVIIVRLFKKLIIWHINLTQITPNCVKMNTLHWAKWVDGNIFFLCAWWVQASRRTLLATFCVFWWLARACSQSAMRLSVAHKIYLKRRKWPQTKKGV